MINYLLGRSEFQKKEKVIGEIRNFDRFDDSENLANADALLIFKNETQQCWLVFTNLRIYFVIDDTEKSVLKAMWARDKTNLIVNGRVSLHLKEEQHSAETGKLFFGKMNNCILYTYALFKGVGISGSILTLAKKHLVDELYDR